MAIIIYPHESYVIHGCLLNVYNGLGRGFLEAVYQEALELELASAGVPFKREVRLPIYYNGVLLKKEYYADFVCYDKIILELKAVSELLKVHKSQVKNYLKASGYQLGILANFGSTSLETARICNSNNLLYQ
ncbi:MAG: GxxExxY protein [Muribaculaceae bacterium]|nr:GxxExxY protein [Muribaculaceae bacterium]